MMMEYLCAVVIKAQVVSAGMTHYISTHRSLDHRLLLERGGKLREPHGIIEVGTKLQNQHSSKHMRHIIQA